MSTDGKKQSHPKYNVYTHLLYIRIIHYLISTKYIFIPIAEHLALRYILKQYHHQ